MFNKHGIIDIDRPSELGESFSQSTSFLAQVDTRLPSQLIVKTFQQWWNIFYTDCDMYKIFDMYKISHIKLT